MEKSFGIVLVACLMAGALAGAATMEVASITVSSLPGSITIPVSLNAEAPFASFQFTLRYNSSILKLVSVDKGPLVAGFTVVNNTSVAGIVRTGGFDPTLSGVSGSGVIANLQFEVLTPGYSYLSLTEVKLSDSLGKSLPCSVRSGFFRVTSTPSQSGNGTAANADATATTISTGSGQASVAVASSGGVSGYTRVQVGETAVSLPAANIPAVPRWEGQPVPGTTIATPGRTTAPPVIPEPGKPPVETPTNSVVLLVKSDYGKTFPVPGVTTYTRGDKVDCRVETAVLVEGQEQIVCTGYEGTGSAPTGSGTSVSFTIREDSKLTWKWEKKPLKKEFIFSCPEKMNFSLQEKELKIPVKVIFLAGFAEPVAVKARVPSGFQIEPAQKELRVEGNEAIFAVRRGPKVLAGNYTLEFEGMAGKVQKTTRVVLTVSGEAKLSNLSLERKKGLAEAALVLSENVGKVSSLRLVLELPENMKFKATQLSEKEIKFFNEVQVERNMVKITGAFFPSFCGQSLLTLLFDLKGLSNEKSSLKLKEVSLWGENGEKIPVVIP